MAVQSMKNPIVIVMLGNEATVDSSLPLRTAKQITIIRINRIFTR